MSSRILVVGTGSIGMRHAESLRKYGHPVVLLSRRKDRVRELSDEGWHCIGNWEQAMAGQCTHVIVASRTMHHTQDVLAALACSPEKILVEKPLAVSIADARPLLELDRSTRRKIYCGFNLRYVESLRFFGRQLESIAPIYSVNVECRSWLPDWRPRSNYRESYSASAIDGGVLRDLIHEIDYTGWLFGWPENVMATIKTSPHLKVSSDDQAYLQCSLANGIMVQIALDYLGRPTRRQATAFGLRGILTWDGTGHLVLLQSADGERQQWRFSDTRESTVTRQHDDFLSSSTQHAVGFEDALRSLAVVDAARASSSSRKMWPVMGLDH